MSYFLKVAKQQNRTYLSIYESFYSDDVKGTKHKCYKSLGNINNLYTDEITDPIAYYKEEVRKLNEETKAKKAAEKAEAQKADTAADSSDAPLLISDIPPVKKVGYFPLCRILNNLDIEEQFDIFQSTRNFKFSVFDVFSALVFARAVEPVSKHKTFYDILPMLGKKYNFSYDQLLEGIEFIGSELSKFTEILTAATKENYGINTSHSYFDCTNFYFEIDKETSFQKRGPSKERRTDPIVGMGLLLDGDMIPVGMKMYPGNESEKPVLRDVISSLKNQNNITGRTIQIADKGLNCARNIIDAVNHSDGYIFSKSVKHLKGTDLEWALDKEGYTEVRNRDGSLHYAYKSKVMEVEYSYDDNGKKYKKKIREKRVITFNPKLQKKKHLELSKMWEKAKKLSASQAKKSEYGECGKYVSFKDAEGNKAEVTLNEENYERDRQLAGYNMIITSEYTMEDRAIYDAYHNLWRIEESFRIMKSELDARPVYLQKENTIKGHFFICYATVLLIRLLQFKELNNKYSSSEICNFMKSFTLIKYKGNKYINVTKASDFITELTKITKHPLNNYFITQKQINMMHTR